MNLTLKMDSVDQILLKRSLNKNGKAQKFFTHEVRRLSDPYVPFRDGPLKNTAVEEVSQIRYVQPYAAVQWYTNSGNGKQGLQKKNAHNVNCNRGRYWTYRMWADRGKEIVKSVARYTGGHSR